ncbi:hypothetical protein [Catenovulum sediminis]|uniref:Uncharacterized protein n=1 Tax=Catenovulum sediminis TaxID=1740262 RepID=A0ABV1RG89_9ALTE
MSDKTKNQQAKNNSALHKLYARQQPKTGQSERVGEVLKTFAEDDYKRIALVIKKWLRDKNTTH